MTVEEAVEFLNWHNYNCSTCHKIAALLQNQQQRLEAAEKVCRAFEAFENAEWAYEEELAIALNKALAEWRGE